MALMLGGTVSKVGVSNVSRSDYVPADSVGYRLQAEDIDTER